MLNQIPVPRHAFHYREIRIMIAAAIDDSAWGVVSAQIRREVPGGQSDGQLERHKPHSETRAPREPHLGNEGEEQARIQGRREEPESVGVQVEPPPHPLGEKKTALQGHHQQIH